MLRRAVTHTHQKKEKTFYPKHSGDFTKARVGLEKCSEILPMPDGLGWEISHLEREEEIKAKKYGTKRKAVLKEPGSQRKKVWPSLEWWGRVRITCLELEILKIFCSQVGKEMGLNCTLAVMASPTDG